MRLRRLSSASSVTAGILGFAAVIVDLLAPAYDWQHGTLTGTSSLLSRGVDPLTVGYMLLVIALCVAFILGGRAIGANGSRLAIISVAVVACALVITSLLGGWFVGPSLYPASIIGLVAAASGVGVYFEAPKTAD
jgi:hypothetical protein